VRQTAARSPQPATRLPTRAERSGFTETSSHADVVSFIDSLQAHAPDAIRVGSMGRTSEGRDIPYVIASRPLAATPADARRLGRPVVYVQGNIHAGEVEGKEALQALLRDLVLDPRPNALDSLVLIAAPIYNADGNERLAPQARHRSEQNGPEMVGVRANAQGLDLNRDYVKAEAPETRAALALLAAWDPEVFVDLHTTNGSYHGYALTYAPSLTPAAPLGAWTRDSLLPALRRRVRERHGVETFDYGNFDAVYVERDFADTVKRGWWTYDHRPRFGTNYYGLRNRVAVLGEAYSHDPFERRVRATHAFARELLSLAAERGDRLRALAREADGCHGACGPAPTAENGGAAGSGAARAGVPIRAALDTTRRPRDVIAEDLARTGDSARTEPGVPPGLRRTGRFRTLRIPVYDRFAPTLVRPLPAAWALDSARADVAARLRLHGLVVERLEGEVRVRAERFMVDSVARAAREFQGHREARLHGRWETAELVLPPGTFVVPGAQPWGALAAYLLEPESDDGLATWNAFGHALDRGDRFPVVRLPGALPAAPRRLLP
jgi:hypothetical protein